MPTKVLKNLFPASLTELDPASALGNDLGMQSFEVYTDGSFKKGWGSWSYLVLLNGKIIRENSARLKKTNSNRMEFQAAIEALKSFPIGSIVNMNTDSRILIDNVDLFPEWNKNNWCKKNDRKIPNVDQFIILNQLINERQVNWRWVKAHSGNPFNERCDQLCVKTRSANP